MEKQRPTVSASAEKRIAPEFPKVSRTLLRCTEVRRQCGYGSQGHQARRQQPQEGIRGARQDVVARRSRRKKLMAATRARPGTNPRSERNRSCSVPELPLVAPPIVH